jgi:hypothetical protein
MKFIHKKINRFLLPLSGIFLINFLLACAMALPDLSDFSEILLVLLIVSIIAIIFYLIFALIFSRLIQNDLVAIFASLSASYLSVYKIFRIMHWPGTLIFLILGGVFAIVAIACTLLSRSGNKN